MPVNSICCFKFKCFGDVKGLLELWQHRALYKSSRTERGRWSGTEKGEEKSVAIRYQSGGVYLSGVMSLARTDTILDKQLFLFWLEAQRHLREALRAVR